MISEIGLIDTQSLEYDFLKIKERTISYHDKRLIASYKSITSRITTPINVSACVDNAVKQNIDNAVWDTGATMSSISESIARSLGIHPIDKGILLTSNGQTETCYYLIDVELAPNIVIRNVRVSSSNFMNRETEFIIGMDIISKGDFFINHSDNKTTFEFNAKYL